MAIHKKKIKDRDIVITVEQVFDQHDSSPLGFVARVSSDYEDIGDGLIPYQGEFVRDDKSHTVIYETEDEARKAAEDYATRRLM